MLAVCHCCLGQRDVATEQLSWLTRCVAVYVQESAAVRGAAWCRSEAAPLAPGESRAFPYAVVEVKLQGQTERPQWVDNLIASGAMLSL